MVACLHPLGAVAVRRSTVGLRMRTSSSKPWETAHKQGMQEHDRIHQNNLCTTSYNLRGACNGRRLRIYGFTDLPPSLPLFLRTPETRIPKSSYRRIFFNTHLTRVSSWLWLPLGGSGLAPGAAFSHSPPPYGRAFERRNPVSAHARYRCKYSVRHNGNHTERPLSACLRGSCSS